MAQRNQINVKALGRAVLDRRLSLDMSQSDLAIEARVTPSFISKLERGLIGSPGAERLDRISNALGLSDWHLLLKPSANGTAPPPATPRERPTDYPSRGAVAAHTEDGAELSDSEERIARRVARLVIDQLKREERQGGQERSGR